LVQKFKPQEDKAIAFVLAVHKLIGKHWNSSNPELASYIQDLAREQLSVDDLYAEEKRSANERLLADEAFWRHFINQSEDGFMTAAHLAVIGNIIDYGAHSLQGDLVQQILSLYEKPLKLNEVEALKAAVRQADSILYLGDNAGEIFFDKLFIEQINHPKLTFATRGYPVINDVTRQDALLMGLHQNGRVVDNGNAAPSTLLPWCSESFMECYHSADLIISKGQGNFEGLMNEKHPNTFFMLIAKCRPIAQLLHVDKGDMLVTRL